MLKYDDIEEAKAVVEELQKTVSSKKYQHKGEESFKDVLSRVCNYIHAEGRCTNLVPQIEELIMAEKFIPAGSILYGLDNNDVNCSLSNCYVTPIEQDSIEGIFDALKKAARTYSYRGGTGIDITVLRPKGMSVNNAAKQSSGAVSFLPLISEVTNAIGQAGRRGAALSSIDVRHPDVLDFIWCKSKPEEIFGRDALTGKLPDVYGANISVKLTDAFMEAVRDDKDFDLIFPDREANPEMYDNYWKGVYEDWDELGGKYKVYKTVKARDIMQAIADSSHASADPGVMFYDTVIKNTPAAYISKQLRPLTSNPCGEQFLSPYNNCLLGAFNLPKYVTKPFTKDADFDIEQFLEDVRLAVFFMNIMSDANQDLHPLKEQREADAYGRRIGIEFTGLGDTLAMLRLRYGTGLSLDFVDNLMLEKSLAELSASVDWARKFGPCPAMQTKEAREKFLKSPYIQKNLEIEEHTKLYEDIMSFGLANVAFNTVGPTGSISIMANNCTSGIEPLFMFSYTRQTRLSDKMFTMIHKPALDHLHVLYSKEELEAGIPLEKIKRDMFYVESHEIKWRDRVEMQAVVQKYTDSSISSTVNLPETATPEEIMQIYLRAWERGLKGITVFRDGCKKGVLTTNEPKKTEAVAHTYNLILKELLDEERARRYKVSWKGAKIYITVTLDDDNEPLEVFVKLPREAGINGNGMYSEETFQEKYSLWETITRLVSLLLRAGMPVEKIIEQLEKSTYSVVDAASILIRILRKFLVSELEDVSTEDIIEQGLGKLCHECGKHAYVYENGCGACRNCGYTTCG